MAKDFKLKGCRIKEINKGNRLYDRYVKDSNKQYYHVTGKRVNIVGTKDFVLLMFKIIQERGQEHI